VGAYLKVRRATRVPILTTLLTAPLSRLIQFYDEAALSPTTVHTVTGLLTHSPAPPSPMSSVETDGESADTPVLFPTIHVLSSFAHTHPLDAPNDVETPDGLPPLSPAEWKEARAELVTLLAQLGLEGEDEWVGEWVLATLCQKNAPPLTPLSVALLAPSAVAGSDSAGPPALPLLYVLEQLVPTLHPLDLSIPLLNSGSFAPRAREKEEDLEAGAWQVPKGGVGYVRESAMGEGGKLNERGASAHATCMASNLVANGRWSCTLNDRHRQPPDARQPRPAPNTRLPVSLLGLLLRPGPRLSGRGRRQGWHPASSASDFPNQAGDTG
jgi:hypothetical protein